MEEEIMNIEKHYGDLRTRDKEGERYLSGLKLGVLLSMSLLQLSCLSTNLMDKNLTISNYVS